MMEPRIDYSRLNPTERLELLEQIWDSLSPRDVPLTPEQAKELERREELYEANPHRGRAWREALDDLDRNPH